jgi:hypothetical protein
VKVLLDENFPLGLVRVLQADGLQVEHIITLNWRGASDTRIRERLSDKDIVFLTQDDDFLFGSPVEATIIVSRVRQSRGLAERVEVWRKAIATLNAAVQTTRVFELSDEGVLEPWLGTPRL